MAEDHGQLLALLVLLVGSFLMTVLGRRLHVPSAVLLIVYGAAVGPGGAALVEPGPVVDFLFELGFVVLMFLAGLEIDFNAIRSRGRRLVVGAGLVGAAILALAFAASTALGLHPLFGLAIGALSVGMPLAVLKETGRLREPLGQTVILVGSLGEFWTLLVMTFVYFGLQHGPSWPMVAGVGKLAAVLVVVALTLRFFVAWAWWQPERFSGVVEVHDGAELGVRASLLLMVAFAVLALLADVEPIVGAFLAGALIAFVLRGKEILERKLAAVGHGLFVPLFFLLVGVRVDLAALTGPNVRLALLLLVVMGLVRALPAAALVGQGLDLRQSAAAASLLAAPLTLIVAIAALGEQLGALPPEAGGTLVALAVLSGLIFPVLFRLLAGGGGARR